MAAILHDLFAFFECGSFVGACVMCVGWTLDAWLEGWL